MKVDHYFLGFTHIQVTSMYSLSSWFVMSLNIAGLSVYLLTLLDF